MFFWGVHRLPYGRFAAFDLVGCLLSAIALAGLGFGLSTSAVALVGRVKRAAGWLLAVLRASRPVPSATRYLIRRDARERGPRRQRGRRMRHGRGGWPRRRQ